METTPATRDISTFTNKRLVLAAGRLRSAVAILDIKGWCQGKTFDNLGRCCAVGAIYWAAEHEMNANGRDQRVDAHLLVNSHLANILPSVLRCRFDGLTAWNDEPGRTKDEVCYELFATAKWIEDHLRTRALDA